MEAVPQPAATRKRACGPAAKPDITPGLDPMGQVRFMEVMVGDKRQFVVFNGPGNSPVVAGQSDEPVNPLPVFRKPERWKRRRNNGRP